MRSIINASLVMLQVLRNIMERLEEDSFDRSLNMETLLPQERYELGLMTGLAGIGYILDIN